MIPYGRQSISEGDIQAVINVLQSDFLTQGPIVPKFERAVADYCQALHGVAANSATSALHIACLALNVRPGDYVWTSPITFVASANCAAYCGAHIDFVDVDPETGNLSVPALTQKLISAEREGVLPKVVIPVHLSGEPCDMEALWQLGQRYGFHIVEDASHAIGARHKSSPVGSCIFSDITVFSFHPVKIITTAEGGLAVTNDADLARRMQLFRTHGITKEVSEMSLPSPMPWYYEQVCLGFNYRMTDVQAALGLSQLNRLDKFVEKRLQVAAIYDRLLGDHVDVPRRDPANRSAMHLYIVRVEDRDGVFRGMRAAGVGVNVHYIPVYKQPWYQRLGAYAELPGAEKFYARCLSIPMFPSITSLQQAQVATALIDLVP